ncbi:helix-turn-helix domain-containing protein [Enterococcus quebecensis]|uniref:HTH araC/xylS-type domain-containing protein n=1 Tax=Enterococcus quebecensis TaxID=903983 RepID=A0A1E5GS50_9ENTE|nr:helix-turn-helix domain-containing protein [Enterococcus quebecensis]OEG15537.1 hypothetical protein BCR23_08710 [Enterococcus quebecensis]
MRELSIFLLSRLHNLNTYRLSFSPFQLTHLHLANKKMDKKYMFERYEEKFIDGMKKPIYLYIVHNLNFALILCTKNEDCYLFVMDLKGQYNKQKLDTLSEILYLSIFNEYQPAYILTDTINFNTRNIIDEMYVNNIEGKIHQNPIVEKQLLHSIKVGNAEEAIDYLETLESIKPILANTTSRNLKNIMISFITLASRAIIDGGLPSEIAYTFSDLTIQNVEKQNNLTVSGLMNQLKEIILEFTQLLGRYRYKNYSKYVGFTIRFVQSNLYTPIKIYKIAEQLEISPGYLSSQFKKEMGLSLNNYIQKEKISEAKFLLKKGKMKVAEISDSLSFSDQSHFIKIFKKYEYMTPMVYQKKHLS